MGKRLFEQGGDVTPSLDMRLASGKSGTPTVNHTWQTVLTFLQSSLDFLTKSSNLNDLPNKATARTNLSVYSKSESDALLLDKADRSNVLLLDNTTPFTPDNPYEPATKNYVDVGGAFASGYYGTIVSSKIDSASFQCTIVKRGGMALMTGQIKATTLPAEDEELFTVPSAVTPFGLFPKFIAGDGNSDTIMEMYFFGNSVYSGGGSSADSIHYFTVTYFV